MRRRQTRQSLIRRHTSTAFLSIALLIVTIISMPTASATETTVEIELYQENFSTSDYFGTEAKVSGTNETIFMIDGDGEIQYRSEGIGSGVESISLTLNITAPGFNTGASFDDWTITDPPNEEYFQWYIMIPIDTPPQMITVTFSGTYHKVNSPDPIIYDIPAVYAYIEVEEYDPPVYDDENGGDGEDGDDIHPSDGEDGSSPDDENIEPEKDKDDDSTPAFQSVAILLALTCVIAYGYARRRRRHH